MPVSTNHRAALLALAALGALSLSGCSSGLSWPVGESGQSAADACVIVAASVLAVTDEIVQASATITSDPEKAADGIRSASTAFGVAMDGVTNEEVGVPARASSSAVASFSEAITAYTHEPKGTDPATVEESSIEVQESFAALEAACG